MKTNHALKTYKPVAFPKICLLLIGMSSLNCMDMDNELPMPGNDTTTSVGMPGRSNSSEPSSSRATAPMQGLPVPVIRTASVLPAEIVEYAITLIGTPYQYASIDPEVGFDCSGFITHVFNHFNIVVPRSSVDFTHVGDEVYYEEAKPGDLILFTGTDSTIDVVGHMGIVVNNENGNLEFIHSTSGKAKGVVITPFESYYRSRFVKVIRLFPSSS